MSHGFWWLCDTFARKNSSLSFLRVNVIWEYFQNRWSACKQKMLTLEEYFQSSLMVEVSERNIGKGFKINVNLCQVQVFNWLSLELKITDVLKDVGTSLLQDPVQNHRKDSTLVYDLSLLWQQKHMISEKVSWQETYSTLVCTRRRKHHSPDGGYLDQFTSDLGKEVH